MDSHLVPAFVTRWLRDTSATGRFRFATNPNRLVQDGPHKPMLCGECEELFQKSEVWFAPEVFAKYVDEELSPDGSVQGKVLAIKHNELLLQFAISVQWRLLADSLDTGSELENPKLQAKLREVEEIWKAYLLGNREDTGPWETHMVFLSNLAGAFGNFPATLHKDLHQYLLRSIDGTPVIHLDKGLCLFAKLGPICLWTTLIPDRPRHMHGTRIKKNGSISFVQSVGDPIFTSFVFMVRPKQVLQATQPSERQRLKFYETIKKDDMQRYLGSGTLQAQLADKILRRRIEP